MHGDYNSSIKKNVSYESLLDYNVYYTEGIENLWYLHVRKVSVK